MGRKIKITEKHLEMILENISVFSDCKGKRIKRNDIVTDSENNRWKVLMFMDKGEVKCVGLDEHNWNIVEYFKANSLNCKDQVKETTTVGSVGGQYDVPLFGVNKK